MPMVFAQRIMPMKIIIFNESGEQKKIAAETSCDVWNDDGWPSQCHILHISDSFIENDIMPLLPLFWENLLIDRMFHCLWCRHTLLV